MNGRIALLGDSILDNAAYTSGGPDVVTHPRGMLPAGWRATLLALDGSLIGDLDGQLSGLPQDMTHLVVSVGGNNDVMDLDILPLRVCSEPEAPVKLGYRVALFERAYRAAINRVLSPRREMVICTIYNASLDTDAGAEALGFSTEEAAAALVMLTTFNDVILRGSLRGQPSGHRAAVGLHRAGGLCQRHRAIGPGRRKDRPCHHPVVRPCPACRRAQQSLFLDDVAGYREERPHDGR